MDPDDTSVAAMADPVLRNIWITQRYHELAARLNATVLGVDLTWCAFAVWASKTAGSVIRNEDLPALVKRLLAEAAAAHLDRLDQAVATHGVGERLLARMHVMAVVDTVCRDVAGRIAAGNQLVFAELAPLFRALAGSGPGAPVELSSAAAGSGTADAPGSCLREAFEFYARAMAGGPAERPWLVLAGNVLAVAHEQERLQPYIAAALDAPVHDTLVDVLHSQVLRRLPPEVRRLTDGVVDEAGRILEKVWQAALTSTMLRLDTPDERLRLCDDLPELGGAMWPAALAALPPGEVGAVYRTWDRTSGRGRPSAARDWAVLTERMNYVVNLFRSRQRHVRLLDPPFSAAQLAALRAGGRPPAPL